MCLLPAVMIYFMNNLAFLVFLALPSAFADPDAGGVFLDVLGKEEGMEKLWVTLSQSNDTDELSQLGCPYPSYDTFNLLSLSYSDNKVIVSPGKVFEYVDFRVQPAQLKSKNNCPTFIAQSNGRSKYSEFLKQLKLSKLNPLKAIQWSVGGDEKRPEIAGPIPTDGKSPLPYAVQLQDNKALTLFGIVGDRVSIFEDSKNIFYAVGRVTDSSSLVIAVKDRDAKAFTIIPGYEFSSVVYPDILAYEQGSEIFFVQNNGGVREGNIELVRIKRP